MMVIEVDEAVVVKANAHRAQVEMDIFDQLPKCVRDVVNESPVGVKVTSIVDKPGNVFLIATDPEEFARRLKRHLRLQARALSNV